jgi:hypothetical protein
VVRIGASHWFGAIWCLVRAQVEGKTVLLGNPRLGEHSVDIGAFSHAQSVALLGQTPPGQDGQAAGTVAADPIASTHRPPLRACMPSASRW